MSQKEIVTVLKVNTENSGNNIKSLKQEIAQLKKTLESAEIGSEEFAKASRDLATAQANLKTILADGKKVVDAADGSYNHLVATMAELKKAWRATADEAKRAEIGKEIDSINTKLKEMDATIGNHQRNVGNYTDSIVEAYQEIQGEVKKTNGVLAGSAKPMDTVTEATYDYGKAWSEVQKGTEQTRAKFESVQKMASGLASGFAALQGVTALVGGENENLQKTLVKVQAAMAIAQGVGGLKDLIEGYTQAKTAFAGATMGLQAMETQTVATTTAMNGATIATNTATVATNNFKKALISTGIGALIVALGTLIANWEKISKLWNNTTPQEEAKKKTKELRLEIEKLAIQSAADKIVRIQELSRAYQKLGDDLAAKKKFIREYAEELEDMGIEMNDVNDAEEIFRNKTKDYCNAVMARAKADAARQAATTLYAEKMSRIAELQSEITTAQEDLYEYGDANQTFLQKVDAFFSRRYGKTIPESQKEDAQALIDTMRGEVTKLQKEADDSMSYLFAFANEQDALANQWLTRGNKNGNGSGGSSSSSSSTDDPAAEAKRIAERAKQALIDTKEEELAELTRIYNEELALLQQHNIATGDLTKEYLDNQTELLKEIENFEGGNEQEQLTALENFYNERIRIYTEAGVSTVELTAQFEAEKNAIIENYDNQRQAALQQIANDSKTQKELEIQELTDEYNTYLELFKNNREQLLLIEEWYQQQLADIDNRYKTEDKVETIADAMRSKYTDLFDWLEGKTNETVATIATGAIEAATIGLNAATQIIGALQEGLDTTKKDDFEKNKKYQKAQVAISTALGIINAFATSNALPQPYGMILAGINAATVATVGAIQTNNINKQQFDKPVETSDTGAGVSPNISMADMIPINYTKDVLTDTETAELNKGNRVYVVESDITETQNDVAVKETNSSF